MIGYLWPQYLFALPGGLLLALILDLMVKFKRAARQSAYQWQSKRIKLLAARPIDRVAIASQAKATFEEDLRIAELHSDLLVKKSAIAKANRDYREKLAKLTRNA